METPLAFLSLKMRAATLLHHSSRPALLHAAIAEDVDQVEGQEQHACGRDVRRGVEVAHLGRWSGPLRLAACRFRRSKVSPTWMV